MIISSGNAADVVLLFLLCRLPELTSPKETEPPSKVCEWSLFNTYSFLSTCLPTCCAFSLVLHLAPAWLPYVIFDPVLEMRASHRARCDVPAHCGVSLWFKNFFLLLPGHEKHFFTSFGRSGNFQTNRWRPERITPNSTVQTLCGKWVYL